MPRLPAVRRLRTEVLAAEWGRNSATRSNEFLENNRAYVGTFDSIESMVLAPSQNRGAVHDACEHHLLVVRAALARALWSKELFIGTSVLDALLFHAYGQPGTSSPIRWVLETIQSHGIHRPGVVIYPLHSLGFLGVGFFHAFSPVRLSYISEQTGLAITPQTNSLQATVGFMQDVKSAFGIRKQMPLNLFRHWFRSRPLDWFIRNPLLVVRVQSFPGAYYENQALLLVKLRFAASYLSMLACMQPRPDQDAVWSLGSTSRINNFETLDFRHYIVLHSPAQRYARHLDGDCVPISGGAQALTELSDLAIEVDTRSWGRRRAFCNRLHSAMGDVQSRYLSKALSRTQRGVEARVMRKLFDSLGYFRRSLRYSISDEDRVVNLAIAVESLLTDGYASGVRDRLVRRARNALRGQRDTRRYQQAVGDLYEARSEIVHSGQKAATAVDLYDARQAFVLCFQAVADRLGNLPQTSGQPVGDLLGD